MPGLLLEIEMRERKDDGDVHTVRGTRKDRESRRAFGEYLVFGHHDSAFNCIILLSALDVP